MTTTSFDSDFIPLMARGRAVPDTDSSLLRGGSRSGLGYELGWTPIGPLPSKLVLRLGDIDVWSLADCPTIEVWLALIGGMTRAWNHLRLDQRYPFGLCPSSPSALGTALDSLRVPDDVLEIRFDEYRQRHDLSRWIEDAGVRTPALWMVREGATMLLDASGVMVRWFLGDVLRTLADMIDAVIARSGAELDPAVIARWRARADAPVGRLEAISLGIDEKRWGDLRSAGVFGDIDRKCLLEDGDEVMAAARMLIDRVRPTTLATLVGNIRRQGPVVTNRLDACSLEARSFAEGFKGQRPFRQGSRLGQWFRAKIGVGSEGERFDPRAQLDDWGVPVLEVEMERSIEALAFWGRSHGPAILLNPKGRSNAGAASGIRGGVMATLAHEICHLLLDRDRALPVAEVLGGEVPAVIEERARSFAAEVLLPQAFAASALQRHENVASTVDMLVRTYGVSRNVAAWQIYNGAATLSVEERRDLKKLVGPRYVSAHSIALR